MSAAVLIRKAEWGDIPSLLGMAKQLHAESWYSHIAFDENRSGTFFVDHILDNEMLYCRVAENGSCIVGAVAGSKMRPNFSSQFATFDSFLYVDPSFRGSLIAFRLWKSFYDWSCSSGAVEMTHGVGTAIKSDVADRFFRGIGMTHVGGIYKLKLATATTVR